MLFDYKYVDQTGTEQKGSINAVNVDVAISSVQKRGFTLVSIQESKDDGVKKRFSFFESVTNKDVVIVSRQISTLFSAKVSALRVFSLLGEESENRILGETFKTITADLQGGTSISGALSRHPKIFSDFYVNMVRSGEETGKLEETFLYLADYLDRNYELTSKAKGALVYPAFVVATFVGVMVLMFTFIIPNITTIIIDSGQPIPIYTQVVIAISDVFVNFGFLMFLALLLAIFAIWKFSQTEGGRYYFDNMKITVPYIGNLYRKLYLSRISDNMNTMLLSGISMVKAVETTASVVDNLIYEDILMNAVDAIKSGSAVSAALAQNDEIPGIMIQMIKIGEETGELGNILKTLSNFYRREVTNAVDSLVSLIEPAMIVCLGVGVGLLLMSVLLPIYEISMSAL
jgi:type IV pilus assembly protein PilC